MAPSAHNHGSRDPRLRSVWDAVRALRGALEAVELALVKAEPSVDQPSSGSDAATDQIVLDWKRREFKEFMLARSGLTPRQWTLVTLLYAEGLAPSEAASRMGVGNSSVSAMLGRAEMARDQQIKRIRSERLELAQSRAESRELA